MNHQPFETWILDEERLSTEDEVALKLHLKTCPDCQILQENWKLIRNEIQQIAPISPKPGFTDRWLMSLPERRKVEYQRLERRFLAFLIIAFIFTLGTILSGSLLFTSPAGLFSRIIETLTAVSVGFHKFLGVVISILGTMPPAIPTLLLIMGASFIGFSILLWLVMLWRISQKRIKIS